MILNGRRKRCATNEKSSLKRFRKSGLEGGAARMSDEDFIDHLKKVIRHLFCFLGPYACDNDPNNRDLKLKALKLFEGLGVKPDGEANLMQHDIKDAAMRELLIYKLRYEMDLLNDSARLRNLFDTTVDKVTVYFLGLYDYYLKEQIPVYGEDDTDLPEVIVTFANGQQIRLGTDRQTLTITHDMGSVRLKLILHDKYPAFDPATSPKEPPALDLHFMFAEPQFPASNDYYYLYYTCVFPYIEKELKESIYYYKVVIAARWGSPRAGEAPPVFRKTLVNEVKDAKSK
ncbi:uncharacterized protein LOC111272035 [Varroa jacobsoni]|nr:uncharacterized protein LOC111272035 [Varroa jacobsoni]